MIADHTCEDCGGDRAALLLVTTLGKRRLCMHLCARCVEVRTKLGQRVAVNVSEPDRGQQE